MRVFAILLAGAIVLSGADGPDPVELGKRSSQAMAENRPKTRQYAFREHYVNREVNSDGKETDRETETWDIIGLEGYSYRKLVARNDQPLSSKEQKREDARLKAETELRRKESPEERKKHIFGLDYSYHMPYDKLTGVFHLRYLGEREFAGRRLQAIEAAPNLDYAAKTDDEKESRNYKFELWLDPEDAFPVRMDAEIVGERSRLQKGTTIRQDFTKLPDGTWMPTFLTIRYAAKLLKIHTVRGEATRTYSDFRRFSAASTIQFTEK